MTILETAVGGIISTFATVSILAHIPIIIKRKKTVSIYIDYLNYIYEYFVPLQNECEKMMADQKYSMSESIQKCFTSIKNDELLNITTDIFNNKICFMMSKFSKNFQEIVELFEKKFKPIKTSEKSAKTVMEIVRSIVVFDVRLICLMVVFDDYCKKRYNKNCLLPYVVGLLLGRVENDCQNIKNLEIVGAQNLEQAQKMKMDLLANLEDIKKEVESVMKETKVSSWLFFTKIFWKNFFSRIECL